MLHALAIVAILAASAHSTVLTTANPAVPSVRYEANPTTVLSDQNSHKKAKITDFGICNEYYEYLLLLENFEDLASHRKVKGKETISKKAAKKLKKIVKSLKKKTKIKDASGKKIDHICWKKKTIRAFYESVLPEFDGVGTIPDLTEAEQSLLTRDPGASRVAHAPVVAGSALPNTAEKLEPCSAFAGCPYADCYACFYGWYLGGSSKEQFESTALFYVYNETYFAEINRPQPFPHSPVEFRDQECKVTHFKYHAFPEPNNLIDSDQGRSCTQAMACDRWITSHNFENNLNDDYQDATHCLCSYAQYAGKSATVAGVVTKFADVCQDSLVTWHGFNTVQND